MSKADNKELEEAVNYFKKRMDICLENAEICDENDFDEEATCLRKEQILIETVLKELKRLQEENKEYKKIKDIADDVKLGEVEEAIKRANKEFIEKDKIREKIEELNKNKDMISGGYAISILEELLEGK